MAWLWPDFLDTPFSGPVAFVAAWPPLAGIGGLARRQIFLAERTLGAEVMPLNMRPA